MASENVLNVALDIPYRLDELAAVLQTPENWGCAEPALLGLVECVHFHRWRNTDIVTVGVKLNNGRIVTHTPRVLPQYQNYRNYVLSAVRECLMQAIREHVARCTDLMATAWEPTE